MNLAVISVAALALAVIVSCFSPVNIGVLALALAWIVGVYIGGLPLNTVIAGFPTNLFLTLAGVTLLFTQAQLNGTLDKLAHQAVRVCRGNTGAIPITFFLLGLGIGSLGPGNIATAAMLAPMGMAVAARARIPAFLMAIMVGYGAGASSLSPFAPAGIIVNGIMERIGLGGYEWRTYWTNALAHAVIAIAGYLAFGGWRLFRAGHVEATELPGEGDRFDARNWITLAVILCVVVAVLFADANIGMAAFVGAAVLNRHYGMNRGFALYADDMKEERPLKKLPGVVAELRGRQGIIGELRAHVAERLDIEHEPDDARSFEAAAHRAVEGQRRAGGDLARSRRACDDPRHSSHVPDPRGRAARRAGVRDRRRRHGGRRSGGRRDPRSTRGPRGSEGCPAERVKTGARRDRSLGDPSSMDTSGSLCQRGA